MGLLEGLQSKLQNSSNSLQSRWSILVRFQPPFYIF